jgi:hypothetical protein
MVLHMCGQNHTGEQPPPMYTKGERRHEKRRTGRRTKSPRHMRLKATWQRTTTLVAMLISACAGSTNHSRLGFGTFGKAGRERRAETTI